MVPMTRGPDGRVVPLSRGDSRGGGLAALSRGSDGRAGLHASQSASVLPDSNGRASRRRQNARGVNEAASGLAASPFAVARLLRLETPKRRKGARANT